MKNIEEKFHALAKALKRSDKHGAWLLIEDITRGKLSSSEKKMLSTYKETYSHLSSLSYVFSLREEIVKIHSTALLIEPIFVLTLMAINYAGLDFGYFEHLKIMWDIALAIPIAALIQWVAQRSSLLDTGISLMFLGYAFYTMPKIAVAETALITIMMIYESYRGYALPTALKAIPSVMLRVYRRQPTKPLNTNGPDIQDAVDTVVATGPDIQDAVDTVVATGPDIQDAVDTIAAVSLDTQTVQITTHLTQVDITQQSSAYINTTLPVHDSRQIILFPDASHADSELHKRIIEEIQAFSKALSETAVILEGDCLNQGNNTFLSAVDTAPYRGIVEEEHIFHVIFNGPASCTGTSDFSSPTSSVQVKTAFKLLDTMPNTLVEVQRYEEFCRRVTLQLKCAIDDDWLLDRTKAYDSMKEIGINLATVTENLSIIFEKFKEIRIILSKLKSNDIILQYFIDTYMKNYLSLLKNFNILSGSIYENAISDGDFEAIKAINHVIEKLNPTTILLRMGAAHFRDEGALTQYLQEKQRAGFFKVLLKTPGEAIEAFEPLKPEWFERHRHHTWAV